MSNLQIAIDGPAVSGKSSAARRLAFRLGFLYLDSGAVYRAIALAILEDLDTHQSGLVRRLDELLLKLQTKESGEGCRVFLGEREVSERIRSEEVTHHVHEASGNPEIRDWVTQYLRHCAGQQSVVMDGRDIGSIVLPQAHFKFYVTASLESRAQRRYQDLESKGEIHELHKLQQAIAMRDAKDESREYGPLVQTPDARLIDNSDLNLDETVEAMLRAIQYAQPLEAQS